MSEENRRPRSTDRKPGETAIPIQVTLLVPMSAATSGDVDTLKEDAIELVRRGRLKLDGIPIRHRLVK